MAEHIHKIMDGWVQIGHTTQGTGDRFNIFIKCSYFDKGADPTDYKFFGEYEDVEFFERERGWGIHFKKVEAKPAGVSIEEEDGEDGFILLTDKDIKRLDVSYADGVMTIQTHSGRRYIRPAGEIHMET